ncbi:helix-turn-helix domain-containing protein [Nonomuraea sp. NPDC050404]|uniref:TetR/AcrR family transcriptional regulator n=1 Tax=Nonomuraea sp. NPDC050404 TaxID=3155783 RepID=UPI0033C703A2
MESARDLFIARGYARVTMNDIARTAGTALKTVYASVGTKTDILHRLIEIDMADSMCKKTVENLRDAADFATSIALVARGTRTDNERSRSTLDLLDASVASDDGARRTWEHVVSGYRAGLRASGEVMLGKGFLDPRYDLDGVTDRLWFCFGLSAWRTLIVECGWTYDEAERTLARQATFIFE